MLFASFCEKDLKPMWYVRCYAKENRGNDLLKSPSMNNFCCVCWCNFKTSYCDFNRQVWQKTSSLLNRKISKHSYLPMSECMSEEKRQHHVPTKVLLLLPFAPVSGGSVILLYFKKFGLTSCIKCASHVCKLKPYSFDNLTSVKKTLESVD